MVFEYAPAPEPASAAAVRSRYGLLIGGEYRSGAGRTTTLNPATGDVLTEVAEAGPDDVAAAVTAARRGFADAWGPMPGPERARYLYRAAGLLRERARELAVLETLDTGRPVGACGVDLRRAAACCFHHAGWADKLRHAVPRHGVPDGDGFADPLPVGVVAQVAGSTPALLTLVGMAAPALACGNTVVLWSATAAPLAALAFAEICRQAGLPAGVVNVVTGGDGTWRDLVGSPEVDAVAFAGPATLAGAVAAAAGGAVPAGAAGRRLTMSTSGAPTSIVFDDAPVDQAVEGVVAGICRGAARLLVQESIADELLAALRRRMARLRLGDPLDRNTDVGAVPSAEALAGLHELSGGAEPWSAPVPLPARGFWLAPTILTQPWQAQRIARGDLAGPVLAVLTFRTPAEAVEFAGDAPRGSAFAVWAEKGSRALAVAGRLPAGVVWINTVDQHDPAVPSGWRRGPGAGGSGGCHELEAYLA